MVDLQSIDIDIDVSLAAIWHVIRCHYDKPI